MFTDSEFMSAKEKEMVLKQWRTFLKTLVRCDFETLEGSDYGYFPACLKGVFTDRLYKHLSLHYGFIAHYNRWGFLSCRFGSREALEETFRQLRQGWVRAEYQDIHQAMMEELQPWITAILVRAS